MSNSSHKGVVSQICDYMFSLPYGAGLSILEAFKKTFPDLEVPYEEMFDIYDEIIACFQSSEEYFLDRSGFIGVSVGLPYSIPLVVRTYDGLIREFKKRRIKNSDYRHLVRIAPGQTLLLDDIQRCSVGWWIVISGQGQFLSDSISKGYEYAYEDNCGTPCDEDRLLVNTSDKDLIVYYVVVFGKGIAVLDDRHECCPSY